MDIKTPKQAYKELKEIQDDKSQHNIIPIVDKNNKPCELKENDEIIIVRTTGRKEKCIYYGESIKYKEFGHWYYSDCVHNKNSYCNIYTDKGSLKYLAVHLYSSWNDITHISEERISKIIINN